MNERTTSMGMVTGDWEIDLAHSIVKIADELTRIADALEDFVYEDDDEEEDSDGKDDE